MPILEKKKNVVLNASDVQAEILVEENVVAVHLSYNKCIMERCKMLKEYAQYITCVRVYLEKSYSIEEAIDMATDECIRNGILEQILRDNRGEVRSMILTEYDEQAHIEYEKELSFEEGLSQGIIAVIKTCKSFGASKPDTIKRIITEFSLDECKATEYIEKYWML